MTSQKKSGRQKEAGGALTEIEVRVEQAQYLKDLNDVAQQTAERAHREFALAVTATVAGQVPEGATIHKIDVERGVLYFKTPESGDAND